MESSFSLTKSVYCENTPRSTEKKFEFLASEVEDFIKEIDVERGGKEMERSVQLIIGFVARNQGRPRTIEKEGMDASKKEMEEE